jgi:hypothetical protein
MTTNRADASTLPTSPLLTPATSDRKVAFAPCILGRGRYSWVWIVPTCPYCGKSHDHYAGALDSDPNLYIGRMFAARCDATDRRRLLPEYATLNLWYVLEPIQVKEPAPANMRVVGDA